MISDCGFRISDWSGKRLARLLALTVLAFAGPLFAQTPPPRFVVAYQDGTRHQGAALIDWHDPTARPQVDGKLLFDPANPMRWVIDRKRQPGPMPDAFVETFTGDRIPGQVVAYVPQGSSYDPQPAHLIVEPSVALRPIKANPMATRPVRVSMAFVRRVVWSGRGRPYSPATAFLRDGRKMTFRAARFSEQSVSLLTADGQKRVSLVDLDEVHMPAADTWDRLLDELAILAPNGTERLLQVETTTGLLATASLPRSSSRTLTNNTETDRFVLGLQPAWSLDTLWVDGMDVYCRRSWPADEVPLSRIYPAEIKVTSSLSSVGNWIGRDRNVDGLSLRCAGQEFGWGVGTQATSFVRYPLPAVAAGFRSLVGLDRLAGAGGCAKMRVRLDTDTAAPLWESPLLIGSAATHDTGALKFPAGAKTLILETYDAHAERPDGADPLEIRDFGDWLDPVLKLDLATWPADALVRIGEQTPGWQGWKAVDVVAGAPTGKPPRWEIWEDKLVDEPGRFAMGVVGERPVSFVRKLKPGPDDRWLVLFAVQPAAKGEPILEVRADGEKLAEFKPPLCDEGHREPTPLAVPLNGLSNLAKDVEFEIRQRGPADAAPIRWTAIRTANQHPTLHRVFEDALEGDQPLDARPELVSDDVHRGSRAIKLVDKKRLVAKFESRARIRERPNFGEFRLLNLVIRKKGAGHVIVDFADVGPRGKTVQLVFGPDKTLWPDAVNTPEQLPDQWVVKRIDLYALFGAMDIAELDVWIPNGEAALVDDVFLARGHDDFRWMTDAPNPEEVNGQAKQEKLAPIVLAAKANTVAIVRPDGKILSGVSIHGEGDVITAAHAIVGLEGEFTIHYPDGKTAKAARKGWSRDFDLGLLKPLEGAGFPTAVPDGLAALNVRQVFVGATHVDKFAAGATPEIAPVDVRRLAGDLLWTNFQKPGMAPGGPLFNEAGQYAAIAVRTSPFGGAIFARTNRLGEFHPRWRNGEAIGRWLEGAEPSLGWTLEEKPTGLTITGLVPGGPAATAGAAVGDLVSKIDGQETRLKADVLNALAERDPGYEAAVDLMRATAPVPVKIKLAPRGL